MSSPAAKQGDLVVGLDTHVVLVPSPGGPVPTPMPMPFNGALVEGLSKSVFIDNRAAAVIGSSAKNNPPHLPTGGPFQRAPKNEGTISSASECVFADNRAVARAADPVRCCNDPADSETGHVVVLGTTTHSG